MHRRQEYKVELHDSKEPLTVFADEVHITGTGDAVFTQVRMVDAYDDKGGSINALGRSTVLMVTKSRLLGFYQVNANAGLLYAESGLINIDKPKIIH